MTKQKAAHLNESPFSVVTAYAADNIPASQGTAVNFF